MQNQDLGGDDLLGPSEDITNADEANISPIKNASRITIKSLQKNKSFAESTPYKEPSMHVRSPTIGNKLQTLTEMKQVNSTKTSRNPSKNEKSAVTSTASLKGPKVEVSLTTNENSKVN